MKLFIESKILELYILQLQAFDVISLSPIRLSVADSNKIYNVRNIIAENLDKSIPILFLSRMVGINQTKLKSGFKQLFGLTIFDYTLDLKMNYAQKLLSEGKLSLADISELIGYSHQNHFSYAFKRKFGYSPGQYRKKN